MNQEENIAELNNIFQSEGNNSERTISPTSMDDSKIDKSATPEKTLKHPGLTFLSLILGGVLLMLVWWNVNQISLRFPLSILIISAVYFFNTSLQGQKIKASAIGLSLITLALSSILVFRDETYTVVISVFATLLTLILLSADFLNGLWWQFRLREALKTASMAVVSFFTGFPLLGLQAIRGKQDRAEKSTEKKALSGVLKGILITIPLIILFSVLFSFADAVFESRLDSLTAWLKNDLLDQAFSRILLTLFFSWLLAAGVWLGLYFKSKPMDLKQDKPLIKPFLGMTETTIALVSLNLLFGFFLIIQFQYLFAGEANISFEGFTYAEYATRGFNELLTAAGIAGIVYYALASFTKRPLPPQKRLFSILGTLLLLQVGVILVSAFKRVGMYVNAYGLTAYRFIPLIFLFFLAAILLSLFVMELRGSFKRLALVLLVALILFSGTLALVNVDRVLAQHNLERALKGENLDYAYLAQELSTDADPYLYQMLNSGTLPEKIQSNLEKVMVCRAVKLDARFAHQSEPNWLDKNFSRARAAELHQENKALNQKWPMSKIYDGYSLGYIIDGEEIYCSSGFDD